MKVGSYTPESFACITMQANESRFEYCATPEIWAMCAFVILGTITIMNYTCFNIGHKVAKMIYHKPPPPPKTWSESVYDGVITGTKYLAIEAIKKKVIG